ncbi:hypothetical protein [Krasilnikovia sp. M28-CT-15]|uniref:hypothetical protein n=1 Tax=Krasilnikovia sp. M28-CT-15 TaxID=3373540 RepID=UPI003875DCE1
MGAARQRSHLRRVLSLALAAVLTVAATTGCNNKKSAETDSKMQEIAAGIQAELATRPGVTKVEVDYQDTFDAPAASVVSITAKHGTDLQPLVDESIKLVWTSKLNPLTSIRVDVTDPQDSSRSIDKLLTFAEAGEKAELERKYGPRPA